MWESVWHSYYHICESSITCRTTKKTFHTFFGVIILSVLTAPLSKRDGLQVTYRIHGIWIFAMFRVTRPSAFCVLIFRAVQAGIIFDFAIIPPKHSMISTTILTRYSAYSLLSPNINSLYLFLLLFFHYRMTFGGRRQSDYINFLQFLPEQYLAL